MKLTTTKTIIITFALDSLFAIPLFIRKFANAESVWAWFGGMGYKLSLYVNIIS